VFKNKLQKPPGLIIGALMVLGLFLLGNLGAPNAAVAQSTGDTLPTRTPTPSPTVTQTSLPAATSTRASWQAKLVNNILGVTGGQGSVFRVSVQGLPNTPIELRSGTQLLTAPAGQNPEYGPFATEFNPVPAGTWTVTVPRLGIAIVVEADGYNLAVIEFAPVDDSPAVLATNTPTPPVVQWQGQLASETAGAGVPFGRLLVRVTGRDGQPVRISTITQPINTAYTGQKPAELGPNTVEFTGLTPGKYIIEPLGLNSPFEVDLKPNVETRVEFNPIIPTPTSTATPTATPVSVYFYPTFTPAPPTNTPPPPQTPTPTQMPIPTQTPPPTDTPPPAPSPTPVTRWIGTIESRTTAADQPGTITVQIMGIEGLPVRLNSDSGQEWRCTTGQDGLGQHLCAFENLAPGQYTVAPEGLGVKLPLPLNQAENITVKFDLESLPPGITGWQAQLKNNTNGSQASSQFESTLRVRVIKGRAGQLITLQPARLPYATRYCAVAHNPVLGDLICEFGQLGPGVYRLEALNTGADFTIFADGRGQAEIEFLPGDSYAAPSPPVVGQGARPNRPTAIPTPTATPVPIVILQPTATLTLTTLPTVTPTPAFAWQGRVVESVFTGAGAIGVRAAGLKDHPVILRSGGWQSPPQLTGTKAELGQYGTEFGGLGPGQYIVDLVDLAQLTVNLQPGEVMLVEFRYDFVNQP